VVIKIAELRTPGFNAHQSIDLPVQHLKHAIETRAAYMPPITTAEMPKHKQSNTKAQQSLKMMLRRPKRTHAEQTGDTWLQKAYKHFMLTIAVLS
jgi:hypothetical protein